MMSQLWCASRARAIELGQALVNAGLIQTVGHDLGFKDAYVFYRFADTHADEGMSTHEFGACGCARLDVCAHVFVAEGGHRVDGRDGHAWRCRDRAQTSL